MSNLPEYEISFFGILSYALVLTTVSLIFFHMTKYKSIELPHTYAAVFSITLISMSVIYIGIALFQYYQRLQKEFDTNDTDEDQEKYEKGYWYGYVILGLILITLQLIICAVMIQKTEV